MAMTKPSSSQVTYSGTTVNKVLEKSVLSYDTYSAASAAAATLPDGQEIEAPDSGGRLARLEVQSGGLVYKRPVVTAVSPELFGGRSDGVYDDSDAFQAAIVVASIARTPMELQDGKSYRITRTVSSKPCIIQSNGRATVIFDNLAGSDGIVFDVADWVGARGGMIGVELVARGSNGGTAVSMPKNSSQYFTYFTNWVFRDIYCRGSVRNTEGYSFCWDYGFSKWFRLSDCTGLDFESVVIQGQYDIQKDPSIQFQDCAIELDAAGAILTARIDDVTFGPIHTGVKWGERAFFSLSNFDIIGTHNGMYMTGVNNVFNEPKIGPGNINSQQYGIYLDGPDTIDFNSVTVRRHRSGWKGATWDWYGIYAANVSDGRIRACTVQPDEGGGAFSGTMYAYALVGSGLGDFSGNFVGPGSDVGVLLDNVIGFCVDNTISAQNASSDILFKLVNNTRRLTIGEYALVSSFAGTVISKDASITEPVSMRNAQPDFQSSSNIVTDWTRTNAAANEKKWRDVIGTNTRAKQLVSDAGVGTNYEIVTRSGSTVTQIEWRADKFKFNTGPTLTTSGTSPEGVVTATIGSIHLCTNSLGGSKLYVKESGTGNTGWVGK